MIRIFFVRVGAGFLGFANGTTCEEIALGGPVGELPFHPDQEIPGFLGTLLAKRVRLTGFPVG